MDAASILLIVAALCFLLEAFNVTIGTLTPKWWALGVAFYILSLVA
jgi:membrane-bound ClpP family serine protease